MHVFVMKDDVAFTPVPAQQLDILRRMRVRIALTAAVAHVGAADLIIDGIIGYSLSEALRGALRG